LGGKWFEWLACILLGKGADNIMRRGLTPSMGRGTDTIMGSGLTPQMGLINHEEGADTIVGRGLTP